MKKYYFLIQSCQMCFFFQIFKPKTDFSSNEYAYLDYRNSASIAIQSFSKYKRVTPRADRAGLKIQGFKLENANFP